MLDKVGRVGLKFYICVKKKDEVNYFVYVYLDCFWDNGIGLGDF